MKVISGAVAFCAVAEDASNLVVPEWSSRRNDDDKAACLIAVRSSKSYVPKWDNDDNLCQLGVLDSSSLSPVSGSPSFGKVAARLLEACQVKNEGWNYSEGLCDELVSELFKDKDVDSVFDTADCGQVRGLVSEHLQHQAAVSALLQRSRRRQNLLAIEGAEATTCSKTCQRIPGGAEQRDDESMLG